MIIVNLNMSRDDVGAVREPHRHAVEQVEKHREI